MGREEREAEPRGDDSPVLEHCGIDIERFERLVEQNNYGQTQYSAEDAE